MVVEECSSCEIWSGEVGARRVFEELIVVA